MRRNRVDQIGEASTVRRPGRCTIVSFRSRWRYGHEPSTCGAIRIHVPDLRAHDHVAGNSTRQRDQVPQTRDSRSVRRHGCGECVLHDLLRWATQDRDFPQVRSIAEVPLDQQKMSAVREPTTWSEANAAWQVESVHLIVRKFLQKHMIDIAVGEIPPVRGEGGSGHPCFQ